MEKQGMKRTRKNKKRKKIKMTLVNIQGILSILFVIMLLKLDILPMKYLLPIIAIIVFLWVVPVISVVTCKKRITSDGVLSICMSIVLLIGSVYLVKTSGMLENISDGNQKVDKMVVAVLEDDPAENIKDAKDYEFGIQLALRGEDVKGTVDKINKSLKKKIKTVECNNLNDQVQELYDGNVQAIIYNDAYTSILEESFKGFSKKTKIIYSHNLISKLDKMVMTREEIEVSKQPFTVYLSGIDVAGSIETSGRSDVNILAVVNPETHQVLLITTPRDYYVALPEISDGMPDKLTHAGIYGIDASMATLSELYDTPVDFYAKVNFTSMIQIVDALGGIDVDSEYEFVTSSDSGKEINVAKGINHFNGEDALAFARERNNVPGGDFQRGKDQEAVLTAMIKKAVSPAILKGASDIMDSVSGNVDTNMSTKQIRALIKNQIMKPAKWNIKSMDAKGEPSFEFCFSMPTMELSVCVPDYESVEEIKMAIDQVQKGEVLSESEVTE